MYFLMKKYTPFNMMIMILLLSLAIIFPMTLYFIFTNKAMILSWTLFSLNSISFSLPLILDTKSCLMSSTVLFISINVMMFSKTYMHNDPFIYRFLYSVMLFVLSMNMLIFIPHLIMLLLGWDGLGLTSFALIIYYQNPKSLGAGIITALTNRMGDGLLLVSIAWMMNTNNWSLMHIWQSQFNILISISILLAAMTKSAQFPFSSWLPAAMAAPTPVSALVHSSTLVTAGVFLLIRFSNLYSSINLFSTLLLISSSLTMLMAGLSATKEFDLKKIIALSTLSQLSVMMFSLAMNFPDLAFFHLITHAMFKALLFICAGSFIHLHDHNQDLRLTGLISTQMPMTVSCFSIANLALCGFPFLAGFYSKDMILESAFASPFNIILFIMITFATALTTTYSMRLSMNTLSAPMSNSPLHPLNDNDINIIIPTSLLSLGAIYSGSMLNWMLPPMISEPFIPFSMKLVTIICISMGALTAFLSNNFSFMLSSKIKKTPMYTEMNSLMWYLTPMTTQFMNSHMHIPHMYMKIIDHGWLEIFGAQGLKTMLTTSTQTIQPLQKTTINHFIHLALLSFIPLMLLI